MKESLSTKYNSGFTKLFFKRFPLEKLKKAMARSNKTYQKVNNKNA